MKRLHFTDDDDDVRKRLRFDRDSDDDDDDGGPEVQVGGRSIEFSDLGLDYVFRIIDTLPMRDVIRLSEASKRIQELVLEALSLRFREWYMDKLPVLLDAWGGIRPWRGPLPWERFVNDELHGSAVGIAWFIENLPVLFPPLQPGTIARLKEAALEAHQEILVANIELDLYDLLSNDQPWDALDISTQAYINRYPSFGDWSQISVAHLYFLVMNSSLMRVDFDARAEEAPYSPSVSSALQILNSFLQDEGVISTLECVKLFSLFWDKSRLLDISGPLFDLCAAGAWRFPEEYDTNVYIDNLAVAYLLNTKLPGAPTGLKTWYGDCQRLSKHWQLGEMPWAIFPNIQSLARVFLARVPDRERYEFDGLRRGDPDRQPMLDTLLLLAESGEPTVVLEAERSPLSAPALGYPVDWDRLFPYALLVENARQRERLVSRQGPIIALCRAVFKSHTERPYGFHSLIDWQHILLEACSYDELLAFIDFNIADIEGESNFSAWLKWSIMDVVTLHRQRPADEDPLSRIFVPNVPRRRVFGIDWIRSQLINPRNVLFYVHFELVSYYLKRYLHMLTTRLGVFDQTSATFLETLDSVCSTVAALLVVYERVDQEPFALHVERARKDEITRCIKPLWGSLGGWRRITTTGEFMLRTMHHFNSHAREFTIKLREWQLDAYWTDRSNKPIGLRTAFDVLLDIIDPEFIDADGGFHTFFASIRYFPTGENYRDPGYQVAHLGYLKTLIAMVHVDLYSLTAALPLARCTQWILTENGAPWFGDGSASPVTKAFETLVKAIFILPFELKFIADDAYFMFWLQLLGALVNAFIDLNPQMRDTVDVLSDIDLLGVFISPLRATGAMWMYRVLFSDPMSGPTLVKIWSNLLRFVCRRPSSSVSFNELVRRQLNDAAQFDYVQLGIRESTLEKRFLALVSNLF